MSVNPLIHRPQSANWLIINDMFPPYPLLPPFHMHVYLFYYYFMYHPNVIDWPPTHLIFLPPPFGLSHLSHPTLFVFIFRWWRPLDWGQNVWLTLTSVPPCDRLELFPETIDIERHQCENVKIVSFTYDAIVKYNTRHMMRKLHGTINWSFTDDLESVYTYACKWPLCLVSAHHI